MTDLCLSPAEVLQLKVENTNLRTRNDELADKLVSAEEALRASADRNMRAGNKLREALGILEGRA